MLGPGIGDVTGEPVGAGMLGYANPAQRTDGIHLRQRCRAFVIVEPASGRRVVLVVAELAMFFRNVRAEVLRRLHGRFGQLYTEANVLLTATHTHAVPGGYAGYPLYNMSTFGFRARTYHAIVDGVVESIERAHDSLAPGRLWLNRDELHDAGANRSLPAFEANPDQDRAVFPGRDRPGEHPAAIRVRRAHDRRVQLVRHARHQPHQPEHFDQRRQQGVRGVSLGTRSIQCGLQRPEGWVRSGIRPDQRRRHVPESPAAPRIAPPPPRWVRARTTTGWYGS